MEISFGEYLRFFFALLFVLGLIGGFAILAKRFGLGNRGPVRRGGAKRLSIVETMAVDAKRRIILVRRDDAEHLLLIGGATELVIETGIVGPSESESIKPPTLQPVPLRPERQS